ncbi:MAG: hypothetical protein WBC21_01375 [Minisyncoccales bacterium]
MTGKSLFWVMVFCIILSLWIYIGDWTWIIVVATGGIIVVASYILALLRDARSHRTLTY